MSFSPFKSMYNSYGLNASDISDWQLQANEIQQYAMISNLSGSIAAKADLVYVDYNLGFKASNSYVNAQISSLQANIANVGNIASKVSKSGDVMTGGLAIGTTTAFGSNNLVFNANNGVNYFIISNSQDPNTNNRFFVTNFSTHTEMGSYSGADGLWKPLLLNSAGGNIGIGYSSIASLTSTLTVNGGIGYNGTLVPLSSGRMLLPSKSSQPVSGLTAGDIYYNSANSHVYFYNGSAYQQLAQNSSIPANYSAFITTGDVVNEASNNGFSLSAYGHSYAGIYSLTFSALVYSVTATAVSEDCICSAVPFGGTVPNGYWTIVSKVAGVNTDTNYSIIARA